MWKFETILFREFMLCQTLHHKFHGRCAEVWALLRSFMNNKHRSRRNAVAKKLKIIFGNRQKINYLFFSLCIVHMEFFSVKANRFRPATKNLQSFHFSSDSSLRLHSTRARLGCVLRFVSRLFCNDLESFSLNLKFKIVFSFNWNWFESKIMKLFSID